MTIELTEQDYKEIAIDRAFMTLYAEGVSPEDYRKLWEKQYGKEYTFNETLAGQQEQWIKELTYED